MSFGVVKDTIHPNVAMISDFKNLNFELTVLCSFALFEKTVEIQI